MTTTTAAATPSAQLVADIRAHLASAPNTAIVVGTYTGRSTVYRQQHASWFMASKRASDRGCYVQSGKRVVYLVPEQIRFGRFVEGK